jgi:hypothetical protein
MEEMSIEEIKESIERLRQRRTAIPALRDYKPQGKGSWKPDEKDKSQDRPVEEVFKDLFNS